MLVSFTNRKCFTHPCWFSSSLFMCVCVVGLLSSFVWLLVGYLVFSMWVGLVLPCLVVRVCMFLYLLVCFLVCQLVCRTSCWIICLFVSWFVHVLLCICFLLLCLFVCLVCSPATASFAYPCVVLFAHVCLHLGGCSFACSFVRLFIRLLVLNMGQRARACVRVWVCARVCSFVCFFIC